jgi:hypothetical protein
MNRIYVCTQSDKVKVRGWAAVTAVVTGVTIAAVAVALFIHLTVKFDLDLTQRAEAQELAQSSVAALTQ